VPSTKAKHRGKLSLNEQCRRAAAVFGCTSQCVYQWSRKGFDVSTPRKLASAIVASPTFAPKYVDLARKLLAGDDKREAPNPEETHLPDPTAATAASDVVTPTAVASGSADDLEQIIGMLQGRLNLYNREIDNHRNIPPAEVKMWAGLVNDTAKAVVANRLAQKKLGIETGDMLSRKECERIAYAIASRLALGVQNVIQRLAPKVAGIESAAEVAKVMESASIEELMVAPMLQAVKVESGVSLPEWFVDAINKGMSSFVEE
jgi:hypothetical protein